MPIAIKNHEKIKIMKAVTVHALLAILRFVILIIFLYWNLQCLLVSVVCWCGLYPSFWFIIITVIITV